MNNKTIDVTAAVIIKDNKLLIAQRPHHDQLASLWEFPGGKKENSETLEECLHRELKEEFEIDASIGKHLISSFFEYPHIKINLEAFLIENYKGEIKLNSHDDVRWISLDEVSKYEFAEADKPILNEIIKSGLL